MLTAQQILNQCFDQAALALRTTVSSAIQWAVTTLNATPVEIPLAGGSAGLSIAENSAMHLVLTISGYDQVSGDALIYSAKVGIKNVAGTTQLIGAPVTDGEKDDASWGFTITADDVNDRLKIMVTGDATNPVAWAITGVVASATF